MTELGNLPIIAAVCALCWITLCAIVVGHEAADKASRKHIEDLYETKIAAASSEIERRHIETARDLWRAARPLSE